MAKHTLAGGSRPAEGSWRRPRTVRRLGLATGADVLIEVAATSNGISDVAAEHERRVTEQPDPALFNERNLS